MILHSLNDFLLQFTDNPLVRKLYSESLIKGLSDEETTLYLLWELTSAQEPQPHCCTCKGDCHES